MVELEADEQLLFHPQLRIDYLESGGAAHTQVYKEKPKGKEKFKKENKHEKCHENVNFIAKQAYCTFQNFLPEQHLQICPQL